MIQTISHFNGIKDIHFGSSPIVVILCSVCIVGVALDGLKIYPHQWHAWVAFFRLIHLILPVI